MQEWPNAQIRWVTPGLFQTLRIALLQGREFTNQDRNPAPQVIIINETLARRAFPGEEALGKHVIMAPNTPPREIVGIVHNTQERDLRETQRALIYLPILQNPNPNIRLVVKARRDPASFANPIRHEVASLDKDLATFNIRTMEEVVGLSLAQTRFTSTLLGIFSTVALVLAAVGVYGVMSYSVNQRTHEFGIRMALGAEYRDVPSMVLRNVLFLSGLGAIVGIAGAFALTRLLADMLFHVNPADPITLGLVALLLILVSISASLIPARRAMTIDPVITLRHE